MKDFCLSIPDSIIEIYKTINSSEFLALFAILVALLIPFATFLIDSSNKTDEEKGYAKVERAVILRYVMHMPVLIAAFLAGSVASLLFIDNKGCDSFVIGLNVVFCAIIITSISIIIWVMFEIIMWLVISARADSVDSFCFKKWKKYLKNIDNENFYDTWDKIFGNRKIPDVLKPAYISIFLDKNNTRDDKKRYYGYRVLYEHLHNISIFNPDILKTIINGVDISFESSILLNKILDEANPVGDIGAFFYYLEKKIDDGINEQEAEVIVQELLFANIEKAIRKKDDDRIMAFANAIPLSWRMCALLDNRQSSNNAMIAKKIASMYPEFLVGLKACGNSMLLNIEHINACIVGDIGREQIDERLLADICEIYTNINYKKLVSDDKKSFESILIDSFMNAETRFFANSNFYTATEKKDGKPDFEPSKRMQENGACKIAQKIFPKYVANHMHIKQMSKEIRKRIKGNPTNYRLHRLSEIYEAIKRNNK